MEPLLSEPHCSPLDQVFSDHNLLYCIVSALSPRGRLRFGTLTHSCAHIVDLPEFWRTISWDIVGGDGRRRWTYPEAAVFGNRFGYVLRKYGRHCTRLQLANCPWLYVTGLEDIGRCRNLVHLDMSGCSSYSVDLLGSLLRNCPLLRSLRARGCSRICEPAIIQEFFDTPAQFSLNLEHLDLQGVLFTQDQIHGRDLGEVVQRLVRDRLVTLRLGWLGEAVDDDSPPYYGCLSEVLRVVAKCGATLRLLDLAGCCPRPIGHLLRPAPEELPAALGALSGLRVLCLSNTAQPSLGEALRRCPTTQLVHLNLRASWDICDHHLIPLLSANPGLRSLNVGCCSQLSDAVLTTLAARCSRLVDLDVCYAGGMTARGVRSVASALGQLTSFGFSGFAGLEDADIADIVQRLPGLKMLGIGGIPRLTDASLRAIAASCRSLETLYAAGLPNVTGAGLQALLAACPALRRVQMDGCPQLAPAEVRLLQESYPYRFDGDMLPEEVVRAEDEFLGPAQGAVVAVGGRC